MKKNPFSFQDFLGYVFPGAFAIIILYYISKLHDGTITIESILTFPYELKEHLKWDDTIWFILLSYVIGHVVAYASSLTIEPYAVWKYGYPSRSLMGMTRMYFDVGQCRPILRKFFIIMWRLIVALVVLPITLCSIIIGDLLHIKIYSILVLDRYTQENIMRKRNALIDKLGLTSNHDENTDFHRIIYHYEYEKKPAHSIKTDNYVALYDFMRAITFIFNGIFIYNLLRIINNCSVVWNGIKIKCFSIYGLNLSDIKITFALMFITYFFFLGFMKFYRRYTLESFMCLLSDEDLIIQNNVGSSENSIIQQDPE